MSKFQELNETLNNILLALTSSQNLCKYVYYDSGNPLVENNITDTSSLLFTKIYPIPQTYTVSTVQQSNVIVLYDTISASKNSRFKEALVKFDIISHIDLWQLSGAVKLRPYAIANEIDNVMNAQRGFGLGRAEFVEAKFLPVNDAFSGYRLIYRLYDFN